MEIIVVFFDFSSFLLEYFCNFEAKILQYGIYFF